MIHCTEDVCSLISNPEYTMKYKPLEKHSVKEYVLTAGDFNNRIEVSFARRFVEICVFKDKNSKYYEKLSLESFAEQFKANKLKDLLKTKLLAATTINTNQKYR